MENSMPITNYIQDSADKLAVRFRELEVSSLDRVQQGVVEARTKGATKLNQLATFVRRAPALNPVAEFLEGKAGEISDLQPLENYDELNVKDVLAALESASLPLLLSVEKYEKSHKNRVTILRAIDKARNPA